MEFTMYENELRCRLNECGIPNYMQYGILDWIIKGLPTGGFLMSIIRNDLKGAVARADQTNIHLIAEYTQFFTWHAPSECWGSDEAADSWKGIQAQGPCAEADESSGDKFEEKV